MTRLVEILKLPGKALLWVLKTAVSFATGVVAAWFLFLVWAYLQRELGFRWMDAVREYAGKYVGAAAFLGCFYETFSLFEARMTAGKRVLVTCLGIVFLTAYFSLSYVVRNAQIPAPDIAEIVRWPGPPSPPKPYEEAMYDVYSDLLQQPPSLWDRLTSSSQYSGGVAIVDETTILQDGSPWLPASRQEFQVRHSDKASILQRKFSLPNYVLITKSEEGDILRGTKGCLTFQQNYPGYLRFVEFSGVDFVRDQTNASLTMMQLDEHGILCKDSYNGLETYVELEKNRHGKWQVIKKQGLSVIN